MGWVEIHIIATADFANELSEQLAQLGAQAVTYQDAGDQPIYEPNTEAPQLWPETKVTGLFEETQPLDAIIAWLEQQQAEGSFKKFYLHYLENEDWERKCLENFHPIRCGQRLWICPSWIKPPHPDSINVILDPGLAFGTGSHPTTSLCLEWLDNHITNESCVIDYGCGSGILGIAALKLGAQKVIGIDNDPQALEATRMNAERNQLSPTQLQTFLPSSQLLAQSDLLIANILARPLIELAPHFTNLIKPGGKLVLSGILKNQADEVLNSYKPWFNMKNLVEKEEWVLLDGILNP